MGDLMMYIHTPDGKIVGVGVTSPDWRDWPHWKYPNGDVLYQKGNSRVYIRGNGSIEFYQMVGSSSEPQVDYEPKPSRSVTREQVMAARILLGLQGRNDGGIS